MTRHNMEEKKKNKVLDLISSFFKRSNKKQEENDFPMAMQEESRIKDGELVLTSTKTRKQELKSALENNFEDVVAKKQKVLGKFQEIINAASYAPLPPSDGLVKKISKL
ncbi:hypothetical protein CQW23_35361 [Capsicum baccatum]|uniref:Uncharacterized protein n=1 Tax=Capsicum baccatum TaxID=33114 RepID=A0A2G2UW59_CAPBA|nr:hypothetical protein CQW23_35361 [Capsicum baccatum]